MAPRFLAIMTLNGEYWCLCCDGMRVKLLHEGRKVRSRRVTNTAESGLGLSLT